jgi:hypothetical protein
MDDVCYYNILMVCKYTDFMALSKTCKKIYRVARTIWKEWIDQKFKTCSTFVDSKDYYKLLKIFSQIKNNTLKDEVSVFVINGKSLSNGKLTLATIMKKLCPEFGIITVYVNPRGRIENPHFSEFRNPFVFLSKLDDNKHQTKIIEMLHKGINTGFTYHELYKGRMCIHKPGTAILLTNASPEIKITGREKNWSQEVLEEDYWNGFQLATVKSLDDNKNKVPRYPLYLDLPYVFEILLRETLLKSV